MDTHGPSRRHSILIITAILAAGCAASPAATGTGLASAGQPTTAAAPTGSPAAEAVAPAHLRMLDPDDKDRPSQPAIDGFLKTLADASGGAITIELQYGAGGTTGSGRERVVTDKVVSGDVELAMAPVRAWADAGVTSVQALGAPFLIDSDPLLTAVATDPLVQPMLDAMADHGLVGLAIWPEDLRHPFAFDSTGGPLLRAEDFKGTSIWTLPSSLQTKVMESLGATAVYDEFPDKLVAAGKIRGLETGLAGGAFTVGGFPTGTGDVTFYPKYQVLVAEDAAWSRLSPAQQDAIRQAARAGTEQAVLTHTPDAANASAYCQAGGTVVLAGPENVATFERAVQPMIEGMRQDSVTATAIDAIQSLKATVPAGSGAVACAPPIDATASLTPVKGGPPITLIPDGVYRYGQTREQLLARGLNPIDAGNNSGTWTLRLTGNVGTWELDHDNGSGKEVCDLTFTLRDDRIRLKCADHPAEWFDLRWALDENHQLVIRFVDVFTGLEYDRAGSEVIFGGPWTKVE